MTGTTVHSKFSWLRILIIIVIILGLLWLFIAYQIQRPSEVSQRVKCRLNLRQIGISLKQYALDNNSILPSWGPDMEPHQAFGKLHPDYVTTLETFRCGSAEDGKWIKDASHIDNIDRNPFDKQACKKSLSYAYSVNRDGGGESIKGPWTESAPSSLRIAADKYTTHDYTIENYPEHRPLNHKIMQRIFGTDRNILRQGCRIFVRLDGSTEIEKSVKLLEADPVTEYEKSGHPESDQTGADWWSDPPEKQ